MIIMSIFAIKIIKINDYNKTIMTERRALWKIHFIVS